jgi:tetratricopeptide (TPR) repeat protein/O-antigen ligase
MVGIFRASSAILLLFAVLVAPWLFGGAVEIHQAWIAWGLAAALLIALAASLPNSDASALGSGRGLPIVLLIGLLAIAWGGIQCIPIPDEMLRILSPCASAFWSRAEGTAATISLYPSSTKTELVRLCLILAAFLTALEVFRSPIWMRYALYLLVINGVLFVIFSWIQELTWNGKIFWVIPYHQTGQPFGAYVNRNHAGGFLNLSLAAALILAFERLFSGLEPVHQRAPVGTQAPLPSSREIRRARRARSHPWLRSEWSFDRTLLMWGSCVVLLAGIFSTQSRGAVVSLLVAGVVTAARLATTLRSKWLIPIAASYAILLGAGLMLTWWVGKGELLQNRMTGIVDDWSAATTGRIDHWADSSKMIPDYWKSGSGLGTYRYLYRMYESAYRPAWYYHAENCYLEVLVEAGILGILLFAGLWITGFWLTRNAPLLEARIQPNQAFKMAIGIAGAHALTTQCVHAALDFNLYMPANAILVSLFFALLSARSIGTRVEPEPPGPNSGVQRPHRPWVSLALAAIMLGNSLFLGLSAPRMWRVGKIAETANRIDEMDFSQPVELASLRETYQQLDRLLQAVPSAEGFDRMARLAELIYRCNVFSILKENLSTADPASIWQLTDVDHLSSRVRAKGPNQEEQLRQIKQDDNIQNGLRVAWDNFGKSIAACPLRATPYLGRARLAFLYSTPQEEEAQIGRALQAAPQDIDLQFDAAKIHFQAGRIEKGIDALRRSLKPSSKYAVDAEVLASAYLPKDDVWQEVYQGLPLQAVAAGRRLAATRERRGIGDQLADVIDKSLSTTQVTDAERHYLVGAAAEFRGDFTAAAQAYEQALMLEPMQHAWHFEYALVLIQIQDLGKALDHVRRSVTLNPRSERYKDLEAELEKQIRSRMGK